jgi:glycogen(starch) synthase
VNLLVVTSLYPPLHLGGYELACAEVAGHLSARGHRVEVLTSAFCAQGRESPVAAEEARVRRSLSFLPWTLAQSEPAQARAWREWRDHAIARRVLSDVRPDVVSVWDLWGLAPGLLVTLSRSGAPVTYAVSSPWPLDLLAIPDRWSAFWSGTGGCGAKRLVKRAVFAPWRGVVDRRMPTTRALPDLRRGFFFSRALKWQHAKGGYNAENAPVVYHGIDLSRFPVRRFPSEDAAADGAMRLLFAGRLTPEKGTHTALEALALLRQDKMGRRFSLDIVGPDADPRYAQALRQRAERDDLRGAVQFHPPVPRETMRMVYGDHDMLLFPSEWEEPFALTLLEAMASGLPVVGTLTGGSGEVLEDRVTGLAFDRGDAAGLARQVRRLAANPGLRLALAREARTRIERGFRIETTVDAIEEFLTDHARSKRPGGALAG